MLKAKQLNICLKLIKISKPAKEQGLPSYTQVAKIRKNISHGIAGPRGKREVGLSFEIHQGRSEWVGRKAEAKRVAPGVHLPLEI